MISSIFGDLYFSTGWKTDTEVILFGKIYRITIKARAYYETDGLTEAQKSAFSDYKNHIESRTNEVERLLLSYAGEDSSTRFIPRTLLFERNGDYALLCDDKDNPDEGVAAVLCPARKIVSQDDYL